MLNSRILTKIYISIFLITSLFILQTKLSYGECIWINKGSGLAGYELTSLAIDKENPNIMYVGAKGSLLKTLDDGESWKNIFNVPGINKAVNSIAIDPKNPEAIYIATESGIFKSEDGGINWQAMSRGIEKDNVLTLHIGSGDKNKLFAGTERDIFITEDACRNWTKSSQGLSGINVRSIAQNYLDNKMLFASCENGLFKSEDGARTWEKILSIDSAIDEENLADEYNEADILSNPPTWVLIDPFDPQIIYLATKRGIFKSSDNGDSWRRLPKAGLSNSHIKNFVIPSYNRGFLFAVAENGVFRFSEKENMWREFYSGLTSKEAAFIALNGQQDTLWLAMKNGVFKSNGDIYEIKEVSLADNAKTILQNFSHEPHYHEIQKAAIEYAEVNPDKIAKWRRAAKTKALLPTLSFGIDRNESRSLHWDTGSTTTPDTWVMGPDEDNTGWDVTCSWDLGDLIWNDDQTSIDTRSKLMVELRDDILDEVTRLYFERRKLQVELMQNPPTDVNKFLEKELRLEELNASIDAMTGGYLSEEIERRKN
jgi:photosystem II stability/assembly factor-like uncharacterized protein